jgi:pyruvate dehydrogenase E1 component alpha subunit
MPKIKIHEAVTERLEILDKDGKVDKDLDPKLSKNQLLELYRNMVLVRRYDEKALKLQRQGRMGTWASMRGQEAAQAGLALALKKEDWLVPSFRENAIMLMHGIPGEVIYRFWKGDEMACAMLPEGIDCLPPAVPIASQLLHAVGVGWALKRQKKKAAAIGFVGDGGTSEGDFHEAMNFAGVFEPNTVLFVQNNGWAISVPFKSQTASSSIAQRGHAYGVSCIQVDGNDALAVYVAAKEALTRARAGKGATLIEALTYRMESHTTADEASRYRPAEDLEYWGKRDPIDRLRKYLVGKKLWNDEKEETLTKEIEVAVDNIVIAFEAMDDVKPEQMFDFMYKEMPWYLREQKEALLDEVKS